MRILHVVGARPNFMKIAPIMKVMEVHPDHFTQMLVHTGQHYDERMSKYFFEDLGMPRPDINLEVGSGTHAEQTARVMVAFEKVCIDKQPDLVIVVGDVNSTMACTITAKKLGVQVAHVEAGLRSRDMDMPEEINWLCTDVLCDYLFTTDRIADQNLLAEGVSKGRIHRVGNVMIDTLLTHKERAGELMLGAEMGLQPGAYATLTLHRPSNVDDRATLAGILEALDEIAREMPIVFPVHPRTRKMIQEFGLNHHFSTSRVASGLWPTEPLGYLELLHLNMNAGLVLTDSGGLQEETTALGVPCITLRHNTERPITCQEGTNQLVGNDKSAILEAVRRVREGEIPVGRVPELWDGTTADRIAAILGGDSLIQAPCEIVSRV